MEASDAFFVASKIIGFLLEPLHLTLALIIIGLLLGRYLPNIGRLFAMLGLLLFVSLGMVPLWQWALQPLENKHPFPDIMPRQVAGIIVLGGAVDVGKVADTRPTAPINSAAERLTEAVALSQKYPLAPIIFSGFSGSLRGHKKNEADLTMQVIGKLIDHEDRIIFEAKSRNTYENAKFTAELIKGPEFRRKYRALSNRFILVTSANHMERSVRAFEAQGLAVIAYPVDYRTPEGQFSWIYDLEIGSDLARKFVHEHLGLLAYEWAGHFEPPL